MKHKGCFTHDNGHMLCITLVMLSSTSMMLDINLEQPCWLVNLYQAWPINREQHWCRAWRRFISTMIKYDINADLASQSNYDEFWYQAWSNWGFPRVSIVTKLTRLRVIKLEHGWASYLNQFWYYTWSWFTSTLFIRNTNAVRGYESCLIKVGAL